MPEKLPNREVQTEPDVCTQCIVAVHIDYDNIEFRIPQLRSKAKLYTLTTTV